MSLSIPQCGSCKRSYTRSNRCHSADDLEVPSLQDILNGLGLPWDETSPEQGYPDSSVDHTLLQNEEDNEEEECETSHDKEFVHSIRLLEGSYELLRGRENVVEGVVGFRGGSKRGGRGVCYLKVRFEMSGMHWYYKPSIWVDNTERSSSPCMRLIVRCRASVTSLFAFMRASSLETPLSSCHRVPWSTNLRSLLP